MKALVALARKLALILHAMPVHGRDLDETLQATAAAACVALPQPRQQRRKALPGRGQVA